MTKFWAEGQTWKWCEQLWEVCLQVRVWGGYVVLSSCCRVIAQVQVASLDDKIKDMFVD